MHPEVVLEQGMKQDCLCSGPNGFCDDCKNEQTRLSFFQVILIDWNEEI
ncbi:hypothetical protein LEP1GSC115_2451 [Leptospira interrogans serovar Australis str. 200703203]|uniref:Uncharacterized protein n=1 Tax=Leptospira interrogans serovar Australis str. 200703203 TaxID=1085541 RepID=N1UIH1_LEPIR|nr:hypothetical protein LEP1GSC115_2451 [Leptospira interrogans serovar Australis str. 200703203]